MITMSEVTRGLKILAVLIVCLTCAAVHANDRTILVFGDSISAGFGMDVDQGWVHLLSQRLKKEDPGYRVVNASVSGETTSGGLVRLPKSLQIHHPAIVVLELGGNDGLRGYPVDIVEQNLGAMTQLALDSGAKVLLIGMVLPPNYGQRYIDSFEAMYPRIAAKFNVPLIPALLDGIATPAKLLQADGIHPKPEAQPMLLDEIWVKLKPMMPADQKSSN